MNLIYFYKKNDTFSYSLRATDTSVSDIKSNVASSSRTTSRRKLVSSGSNIFDSDSSEEFQSGNKRMKIWDETKDQQLTKDKEAAVMSCSEDDDLVNTVRPLVKDTKTTNEGTSGKDKQTSSNVTSVVHPVELYLPIERLVFPDLQFSATTPLNIPKQFSRTSKNIRKFIIFVDILYYHLKKKLYN